MLTFLKISEKISDSQSCVFSRFDRIYTKSANAVLSIREHFCILLYEPWKNASNQTLSEIDFSKFPGKEHRNTGFY